MCLKHTEASQLPSMPICQFFESHVMLLCPPSMVPVVTNKYDELNLRYGILSLPKPIFVAKLERVRQFKL